MTPIEAKMLQCMRSNILPSLGVEGMPERSLDDLMRLFDARSVGRSRTIAFAPQVHAHGYILDFCIIASAALSPIVIGVECDGHDFHEKTKEQAARDKRRDRALVLGGLRAVFRFTGSEVWNHPMKCLLDTAVLIRNERRSQFEQEHFASIDAVAAELAEASNET